MILADFEITVWLEQPRAVRVVVYDNLKGLRIAATRYDNVTRSKKKRLRNANSDALGICHRFEWLNEHDESQPLCAIVRLARPHIGVGVISHELAHAAVWIRQLSEGEKPLVADDDEEFCWVLGELVSKAANVMIGLGVYDDEDA